MSAPAAPALPLEPAAEGVRLRVRLTPKAAREAIGPLAAEADGTAVLKCSVTAVPEDGKANAALIKMLAKAWKLPKTAITVIAGATDRRKTLLIAGDPSTLISSLSKFFPQV